MSERTILRDMLVTDLYAHKVSVTKFGDEYPQYAIAFVEATLIGYGIEVQRRYYNRDEPRIGDRVDVEL